MINDVRDLMPGDIGFAMIPGRVGAWVSIGQALLRDSCRWTHAFLVIDRGQAVEAMPAGARIVPLEPRTGEHFAYLRLPLTEIQREAVATVGRSLEGTPYSFADYLALAALEWRLPGHRLLRGYVADSGHMICSQLVDHALCRGGYHLFDDGRWSQDVTPGALFWQALRLGWVLGHPGRSEPRDSL